MQYLRLLACSLIIPTSLFSGGVWAQGAAATYPSKPVAVIVPYAPGGSAEREARLESLKMSELMGQQFIVDFKPGAGTTVGSAFVARAAPDGYTLLAVPSGFTIFPALYRGLTFDTIKDFAPISLMTQKAMLLVVTPSFPAKTFAEYLTYARANPGKINYATSGAGDIIHLAGEWMHSATNTKATFVHYKGTGPLLPDLIAGRVNASVAALSAAAPLLKSGKLRALAVTNNVRFKVIPDVPTIAEQGVPGFNASLWQGFSAPAATPAPIINKLSEGFARVVKAPEVAGPLEAEGAIMVGSTPAQFRQLIVEETARWRKLVQDNNIKLER